MISAHARGRGVNCNVYIRGTMCYNGKDIAEIINKEWSSAVKYSCVRFCYISEKCWKSEKENCL